MDEGDRRLRNLTYALLVERGRAPTSADLARATGRPQSEVRAGWRRLHHAHALVLDTVTAEIRMANPFSAVPTAYRVRAAGRWWYANCAWDAFGISAALRSDAQVETACPDCEHAVHVSVRGSLPDDESLIFHCLVPAARWWDDITFT